MQTTQIDSWLEEAIIQLMERESGSGSSISKQDAKLDAMILLQHVSGFSRATIMAFGERELTQEQFRALDQLLSRRIMGEPIAYITGKKSFWSLDLAVAICTLIPRPDTEILVETALSYMDTYRREAHDRQIKDQENIQHLDILDLGCGTGAISLAIDKELTEISNSRLTWQVTGIDEQLEAVNLAKQNAEFNHLYKTKFFQSNWFSALENQKFDFILSNPPYLDEEDHHLKEGDVRFEPRSALVADESGLADLRFIIEQSPKFIRSNGWILLEHGWQQAKQVCQLLEDNGWQEVRNIKDYGGQPRISIGCWNK